MLGRLLVCVLAALFPQAAHTAVPAQPDFYKGKAVTLITSTGVGGTYDLIARLVARHMLRYIPGNPTMVVQNMPGAGNVLATNYMYNSAPKDAPASRSSTMPFRCIR